MAYVFPKFSKFPNPNCPNTNSFKIDLGLFSDFVECLGVSKDKINGVGVQGRVRTSRNHENERFEGPHISRSKSYKLIEAE